MTNTTTTITIDCNLPIGTIIMWSKPTNISVVSTPTQITNYTTHNRNAQFPRGWYVCNGTNGTPDLSEKFIKGTTTPTSVGGTGGSHTKTLATANLPSHAHTLNSHTHSYTHGHSVPSNGAHTHSYTHNHTGSTSSAGSHTHTVSHTHSASETSAGSHTHTITIDSGGGTTSSAGSHTHTVNLGIKTTTDDDTLSRHYHPIYWHVNNTGVNGPNAGNGAHMHPIRMNNWKAGDNANYRDMIELNTSNGNLTKFGTNDRKDSGSHSHNAYAMPYTSSISSPGSGRTSDITANTSGKDSKHQHTFTYTTVLTASSAGSHAHTYIHNHTGSSASAGSHVHNITIGNTSATAASAGSHTHTITIDSGGGTSSSAGSHTHTIPYTTFTTGAASGNTGSVGSGTAFDIQPAYYQVVFIMRIS